MPQRQTNAPRTKEELLNKMLSYDFNGDIRTLGEGARIERTAANALTLHFPEIGRTYELVARIPRSTAKAGRKPGAQEEDWTAPAVEPEKPKRRSRAKHA